MGLAQIVREVGACFEDNVVFGQPEVEFLPSLRVEWKSMSKNIQ